MTSRHDIIITKNGKEKVAFSAQKEGNIFDVVSTDQQSDVRAILRCGWYDLTTIVVLL